MKKITISFIVFILTLCFLSTVVGAESEEVEISGETSEFYIEIRDRLQNYLNDLESGTITDEEFESLVNENITIYLETEEQQEALIKSEEKSVEEEITIFALEPTYKFKQFGVNSREIVLFSLYPYESSLAKNLATLATNTAYERYKDYTCWQGNCDAFRHAYWSALMTKYISRSYAHQAGYAHEGYPVDTYDKIKSLDDKMDIRNNHLGRIDGTTYKKDTDQQISNKIAQSIDKGDKVRIRTYISGKADAYIAGVPTKLYNKFVPTTNGGRVK